MTTPVHAFRADYITAAVAQITHRSPSDRPVDKDTLTMWRSYADAAAELGFSLTAQMWESIVSHATIASDECDQWLTSAEVEENLLADWTHLGLNDEQAWQAMWLV